VGIGIQIHSAQHGHRKRRWKKMIVEEGVFAIAFAHHTPRRAGALMKADA
jgi:hypothetical protein